MTETILRVGPSTWKPTVEAPAARFECHGCGGTAWVAADQSLAGSRIKALKCANCGRRRFPTRGEERD